MKTSFEDYSSSIRKKFNLNNLDYWVIEQIYLTLQSHPGGFLFKIENNFFLGLKVHKINDYCFKIIFKDPLSSQIQSININSRILRTEDNRKLKIQWFGIFDELRKRNENPSFSLLDKYDYELLLPKEFRTMAIKEKNLVGDYCAFFALNSEIKLNF